MNRVEYLYIKTDKAISLWNKWVMNPTEWNRDRFVDAMHDVTLILSAHGEQTGNTPIVLQAQKKAHYVAHNAMVDINAFYDTRTIAMFRELLAIVKHLQRS